MVRKGHKWSLLLRLVFVGLWQPSAERQQILDGERCVSRGDVDFDAEFAFCFTLENAARRRYIVVVPSDGDTNVPLACEDVVGGIEPHPTSLRQVGFDPGV